MRRAARTDANHAEIVRVLRAAGCGVLDLSKVGNGCPDLLVHGPVHPWTVRLLEVKDGKRPPSERKLTPAQEKFHGLWKGWVHVVHSPAEALAVVGVEGST